MFLLKETIRVTLFYHSWKQQTHSNCAVYNCVHDKSSLSHLISSVDEKDVFCCTTNRIWPCSNISLLWLVVTSYNCILACDHWQPVLETENELRFPQPTDMCIAVIIWPERVFHFTTRWLHSVSVNRQKPFQAKWPDEGFYISLFFITHIRTKKQPYL